MTHPPADAICYACFRPQSRNTRVYSVHCYTISSFLITLIGLRLAITHGEGTGLVWTSSNECLRFARASPDICCLFLFVFFFSPNFRLTRASDLNLSASQARYSSRCYSLSSFIWTASQTTLDAYLRTLWWLNVTWASRISRFIGLFLTKSQSLLDPSIISRTSCACKARVGFYNYLYPYSAHH